MLVADFPVYDVLCVTMICRPNKFLPGLFHKA